MIKVADTIRVDDKVKGAFVAWTSYAGRTQGFIDALGLTPIYVHYLKLRRPIYAPFKYGPQFLSTMCALYRVRPNVVFVMDPPVFAVAAVYLYCSLSGARYVMDCHSGVFESAKWRWSLPLQRFFGRRAAAVVVTNSKHQQIVASWPAKPVIMGDPPPSIPPLSGKAPKSHKGKTIIVINRFAPDEVVEEMLAAAGRFPYVHFYVTGDTSRAHPSWLRDHPTNVTFTGWLSTEDFWSYLQQANAILTLTTQANTILRGGWEAMFLGQPLITSYTKNLSDYFTRGTVFVKNTPDGIASGISDCLARESALRTEMEALRDEKHLLWRQELHDLERLLRIEFSSPQKDTHNTRCSVD